MFLVGIISWWYGDGWKRHLHGTATRIVASAEFFSIGQLLATLFSPFRQIAAGNLSGSINVQAKAFVDKTVSRFIGAIVRTLTIIAGCVYLAVQLGLELVVILLWLALPAFPVIGFILFAIGWTPTWK